MNELHRPPRWKLLGIILALVIGAVAAIWAWPEATRQERVLRTGAALVAGGLLGFIWLLLFSRLPWRIRWLGVGLLVAGLALLPALLRIRGVSGDLVPIVEFRWKSEPPAVAPAASGPANPPLLSAELSYPQFGGPKRNGVLRQPVLQTNWAQFPLQLLWRKPAGAAWSGFALAGQHAVTQEQRGEDELVTAHDLASGTLLWTHSDAARYATTIAGEGPRATPTIVSNSVYTLGGSGILNCLELTTGQSRWQRNVLQDHEASLPDWGLASSPLVWNGQVIVAVGGANSAVASYAADTGQPLWTAGSGGPDYSSAVAMRLLEQEQIVIFNTPGLNGLDGSGKILWQYPWPGGHPHISLPLALGTNEVLVSSGYGTGAERLRFGRTDDGNFTVQRVWKSLAMKSKFGMLHQKEGYLYGLDDGMMACVDLADGKRRWKDGRYGHGQSLLVAGIILMLAENGEAVLIEPNPDRLVELARHRLLTGKTWNPPCLAGEYLLARNDQEMACFKLGAVPR